MKYAIVILALLIPLGTKAQTVVPIQNPSFELPTNLPDSNKCGQSTWQNIPGWAFTQPAGSSYGIIAWTCEPVPDGKQVAFLAYGASMSQDLKIAPQANVVYTMKFWVANWFYAYPATYSVSLTIGTKPVCTTSGYAVGDFAEVTLVCPVSGYLVIDHGFGFGTGNLGISVKQNYNGDVGWPLLIDDFSLMFTPNN